MMSFTQTIIFCFNPHLRVGGDLRKATLQANVASFNPHLRVGGDLERVVAVCQPQQVSIHTSAWEVTDSMVGQLRGIIGFNPHLRVGGDLYQRAA